MKYRILTVTMLAAMTLLLHACSGGEGGTGATSGDVSRGQITGFGSIFVNGVRFETTNSDITLDGVAGAESDLRLGMIVTVNGTINTDGITGTADSVSVEEAITGLVQNNDGVNTLTVLNHTVELPSNVRFDGVNDITGITAMVDFVEVSGYVTGDGLISATRVELLGSGETESEIFGFVTNLNTGANTFDIGPGLTVNYAAAELSGFDGNALANGLYVEVEGVFDIGSGVLTASSVENAVISDTDVGEIEVEGFVTSVISSTSFVLGDVTVQTDLLTDFEGGAADEITQGMFLEVEGALENGILMATEVKFDDEIRIEGQVDSVAASSFTLAGMPGLTIETDSLTDFNPGFPVVTDNVRVRGYPLDANTIMARRVDTLGAGSSVSLQGSVTAIIAPETIFAINGVTIDTTGLPDTAFQKDGDTIGREEFFSSLEVGSDDLVEASGTLNGSTITWDTVELLD